MERIFIDREWCIAYVLIAISNIDNSANKERKVEDFIEEVKVASEIYTDDINIRKTSKKLIKLLRNKVIKIENNSNLFNLRKNG